MTAKRDWLPTSTDHDGGDENDSMQCHCGRVHRMSVTDLGDTLLARIVCQHGTRSGARSLPPLAFTYASYHRTVTITGTVSL